MKTTARRRVAKNRRRHAITQSKSDKAFRVGTKVALHVLSNPEALRAAGGLLKAVGEAMERTADKMPEEKKPNG